MKKLFLSFTLLGSLNSLSAMDNSRRIIAIGGAITSALAGAEIAQRRRCDGAIRFYDADKNPVTYSKEKRHYLLKSASAGAIQMGSLLTAGILGWYSYSGDLPSNTVRSYLSALSIVGGGYLCELALAYTAIKNSRVPHKKILFGGSTLALLGIYGLYTNK